MTTHVLFILDASGSMAGQAGDVRGGYNGWIEQAVADGQDFKITLTTFNTSVQRLATAVPVAEAPKLDPTNYAPSGFTALLDAVGQTIRAFQQATTLGPDDKVLVHIETDGQENASREYNHDAVAAIVAERAADQWAFVYAGIGLSDWGDANRSGLGAMTVNSAAGAAGTRARMGGSYAVTRSYAGGQTAAADVSSQLQAEIDKREGEQA